MKSTMILISQIILIISVASCKKGVVQSGLLAAKWNIVNDSSSIYNNSIDGSNYVGKSNDYYNFNTGGTLYVNEDSLVYTRSYSIVSNNQVDIFYNPSNNIESRQSYHITNFTEHSVTLTLFAGSLGPAMIQIINLKR